MEEASYDDDRLQLVTPKLTPDPGQQLHREIALSLDPRDIIDGARTRAQSQSRKTAYTTTLQEENEGFRTAFSAGLNFQKNQGSIVRISL